MTWFSWISLCLLSNGIDCTRAFRQGTFSARHTCDALAAPTTITGCPADVAENDYIGSHGPGRRHAGRETHRRDRRLDQRQGSSPGTIARGLGDEEHASRDLGRDGCSRELLHLGSRIKVRFFSGADLDASRPTRAQAGRQGYHGGVPMGARSPGLSRSPTYHGLGLEGPGRRQPRPYPDHQGLGGRQRESRGPGDRRRLERRTASRARTASCLGRQHGGREAGDVTRTRSAV